MLLNNQEWNNERIENIFFLFKKEQGAGNYGDRHRFSSKILPISEKSLSDYALGHRVETTAVS